MTGGGTAHGALLALPRLKLDRFCLDSHCLGMRRFRHFNIQNAVLQSGIHPGRIDVRWKINDAHDFVCAPL